MFKLVWFIGLFLLGNAFSASVSVNSNKHVFIRNVDFDSLLEDEDFWEWKEESWFLPSAMLRTPSITSGQVTLFARIQGKGFVKHSVESYALRLVNPTTNVTLALSPFIAAKTPQVLEFTFDVDTALADSVFALQVVHFTKPVPFIPLEGQPPGLNTIDGTKIPEDTGREIFISTTTLPGMDVSKANGTCWVEAGRDSFVAVLSTFETSALELVLNTGVSPTFPSRWYNRYGASLVYDPVSRAAVVPFLTTSSTYFNTRILSRTGSYSTRYWTGSTRYGNTYYNYDCAHWTSSSANGRVGYASYTTYRWMEYAAYACTNSYAVLCLEVKDLAEQRAENLRLLANGDGLIYTAGT